MDAMTSLDDRTVTLTRMQDRIINELLLGKANKQIARTLGTSDDTVKSHVRRVMKKTGTHNRVELVLYMLTAGYVSRYAPPLHRVVVVARSKS